MSRQRTIHLSTRALSAIRPHDALSPRINQLLERYLALVGAAGSTDDGVIAKTVRDYAAEDARDLMEARRAALV